MAKREVKKAQTFFVSYYYDAGTFVGHRLEDHDTAPRTLADFQAQKSTNNSSSQSIVDEPDGRFLTVFHDFTTALLGFLEFGTFFAGIAPMMSREMMSRSTTSFAQKHGKQIRLTDEVATYEIPISERVEYLRLMASVSSMFNSTRDVPRMMTVGLMSTFEFHIGRTMQCLAEIRPESIINDSTEINIGELVAAGGTLEGIRRSKIDKAIDGALRGSLAEQISWIERISGSKEKFSDNFDGWDRLIELSLRRNIFVHNNSLVNQKYLDAVANHKTSTTASLKVGDRIDPSETYFFNSVNLVCRFGVQLIQVAWRKMLPDTADRATSILNEFGFELLVQGHYDLAVDVFSGGVFLLERDKVTSDRRRRMMAVNFANALRLSGNVKKSREVLDKFDWSAASDEFKLCVAAVRADVDEVIKIMRKVKKSSETPRIEDYQEWPVFYHVRDNEKFRAAFSKIYGVDFVPAPKTRASLSRIMQLFRNESDGSGDSSTNVPGGDETSSSTRH